VFAWHLRCFGFLDMHFVERWAMVNEIMQCHWLDTSSI
jgi:hypothetical protein